MLTNLNTNNILEVITNLMYKESNETAYMQEEDWNDYSKIRSAIKKFNKNSNSEFIGRLSVKNEGEYGFVNFGNDSVFCHNSISEELSEMNGKLVIVKYKKGKKGKKGYKIKPFEFLDDNHKIILLKYILKKDNIKSYMDDIYKFNDSDDRCYIGYLQIDENGVYSVGMDTDNYLCPTEIAEKYPEALNKLVLVTLTDEDDDIFIECKSMIPLQI